MCRGDNSKGSLAWLVGWRGGGGEQWPAEDSLTKETAQYEEEKKAYRQRIQPNKSFKKYPPQI